MMQLGPPRSQLYPRLHVSIVQQEDEFKQMGESWNRLVRETVTPSLFLLHEWFDAAWAWRKRDGSLFVLCAYESDQLVGILPLLSLRQIESSNQARRLEFLTVPDTQLCDLIARSDLRVG